MASITFKVYNDTLTNGPFPYKHLNQIDGLKVTVKHSQEPFREEVTLTFEHDKDIYQTIFIVGQYAFKLMQQYMNASQN